MTPSAAIVAAAAAAHDVRDAEGRVLTIARLGVLDRLRLFKAAGAELARNDTWLGMAMLACSVRAIDGVPMPQPASEAMIEAAVARLGEAGIAAAAAAFAPEEAAPPRAQVAADAGN
jgi:hypothetical protein